MTSDPRSVLQKMRALHPETPETVYAEHAKGMAADRATIKRAIAVSKGVSDGAKRSPDGALLPEEQTEVEKLANAIKLQKAKDSIRTKEVL